MSSRLNAFVGCAIISTSTSLPSEYKHLSRNIRETLNEFKVYAGRNIIIEYKDPTAASPDSVKQELYGSLQQAGITPRTVKQQDGNKVVFPGAILKYGDKRLGINFLKDGVNGVEEKFDQSIAELEYELASTIKVLQQERKKIVGFVRGHGEADPKYLKGVCILKEGYRGGIPLQPMVGLTF